MCLIHIFVIFLIASMTFHSRYREDVDSSVSSLSCCWCVAVVLHGCHLLTSWIVCRRLFLCRAFFRLAYLICALFGFRLSCSYQLGASNYGMRWSILQHRHLDSWCSFHQDSICLVVLFDTWFVHRWIHNLWPYVFQVEYRIYASRQNSYTFHTESTYSGQRWCLRACPSNSEISALSSRISERTWQL